MSQVKREPFGNLPRKPAQLSITRPCISCVPSRSEAWINDESKLTGGLVGYNNYYKKRQAKELMAKYHNVQYHPGQLNMLKTSIEQKPEIPTLILVSTSLPHDTHFFDDLIQSNGIRRSYRYVKATKSNKNLKASLDQYHVISLPVKIFSNCVEDEAYYDRRNADCWDLTELPRLLKYVTDAQERDPDYEVRISQVVITKDHDLPYLFGVGTLCIHLIQPFYLSEYKPAQTMFKSHISLVNHFAYDTMYCSPILPPSIMAFILCYMDHVGAIPFHKIDLLYEWFMKAAPSNHVHLAFTGKMEYIRQYCFVVLDELISVDWKSRMVVPVRYEGLKAQAELLVPKMARLGIISYAMLLAANSRSVNPHNKLKEGMRISRKKIIHYASQTLDFLQNRMLVKPPCQTRDDYVLETFQAMGQIYGYFMLTDPQKMNKTQQNFNLVDEDSDYPSDIDDTPAKEPWIILSPRDYRINRLNLCLNAIHEYAREEFAKSTTRRGDVPCAPSPTEINSKFLN